MSVATLLPVDLLWADIGAEDFIKILVAVLFVAVPLVGKLLNMLNAPAPPAKRPAPPPVPAGGAKPRIPPKAANPELNSEVEEFLRRAAERRGAEQRREAATASQKPEQQAASRRPTPPPSREEPRKSRQKKKPREKMQLESLDDVKRGSDVADHVAKHFKQHAVLERSPNAQSVDQADEAMEEHLHSVFDHQLGSLRRPDGARVPLGEAAKVTQNDEAIAETNALANLLRDPQSVRQAIVLNEILARPEHRW